MLYIYIYRNTRGRDREHAAKQLHLETNPSKKIIDESRRSACKICAAQSRISLQDPFMKCVLPRFMDGGMILDRSMFFKKKYNPSVGQKNQRLGKWMAWAFPPAFSDGDGRRVVGIANEKGA